MARSSSASNPSKARIAAVATAADAVRSAPGDVAALARLAAQLDELGRKPEALKAFATLARAAAEDGQLALAAYAARVLERQGDAAAARELGAAVARAYGAGSARLDPALRPRPPAPPGRRAATEPGGAPQAMSEAAALKKAAEAIEAASQAAEEAAKKGGRLPKVPLVASLEPAALESLIGVMRPMARSLGDVIVELGDEATALYLVARGALRVTRGDHELGHLRAGAVFGEIALLGGTRRTARVTCENDCWLLEIPRDALEAAAAKAPGLADTLAGYARQRLLANAMRTSEVFRRLDPAERERLVHRFDPQVIEAGTTVLAEGQEGERLHVIVSGDAEVRRGGVVLARLGSGDVFGEMSLLGRKPAVADVVALTRTVTLTLDRARFDDVAVRYPQVLADVYKILVEREASNRAAGTIEIEEIVL